MSISLRFYLPLRKLKLSLDQLENSISKMLLQNHYKEKSNQRVAPFLSWLGTHFLYCTMYNKGCIQNCTTTQKICTDISQHYYSSLFCCYTNVKTPFSVFGKKRAEFCELNDVI